MPFAKSRMERKSMKRSFLRKESLRGYGGLHLTEDKAKLSNKQ